MATKSSDSRAAAGARRRRWRAPALAVALAAPLVAGSCAEPPGRGLPPGRVLVLGLDGATWDVILPMIEAGELPNLRAVWERSIRGVLRTRRPVESPVVWTTVFTGKLPEEHGVVSWEQSQASYRRVRALWEMTTARGLRTDVLNVPGSWPPDPVAGVMLSGFPIPDASRIGTGAVLGIDDLGDERTPGAYRLSAGEIAERFEALADGEWSPWFAGRSIGPGMHGVLRIKRLDARRLYASPYYRTDGGLGIAQPPEILATLRDELGADYIAEGPGWSLFDRPETPGYLYEHLLQVFDLQCRTAERFAAGDWDLFIYVATLIDRVSHPYWAYFHPEDYRDVDPLQVERHGDTVRESYRESDRRLGSLLAAARGEYYLVVASDHGFQSYRGEDGRKHVGDHALEGIYLVSGPGIGGEEGGEAVIEDVGPTVLHLLGLPLGRDMRGAVIPEVRRAVGREPERIATWEDAARDGRAGAVDAATWEQLRSLGYVSGPAPEPEPTEEDGEPE